MTKRNAFSRLGAALLLCALTLALCLPATAASAKTRIFDEAQLFSESEEAKIMVAIGQLQERTNMDYVIVTSDEPHEGADQQQIADAFYDNEKFGFGLDEENSGVLIYIDMYERQVYLSTTGVMIDVITDERLERVLDVIAPKLTSRQYAAGALAALEKIGQYFKANGDPDIPEGQFRYDVVTGQILTARHKALTSGEILLAAAVGAAVALIVGLCIRRSYKLKGSTYSYNYRNNSEMNLTQDRDEFLRTTTTRVPKAENNGGGGSGGGFGGGGSGVHSGGGGVSHGGGGRGF